MAEYHTVYKGPEGETTQWEDIHVRLGNMAPRPKPPKPAPYAPPSEAARDAAWLEQQDPDGLEAAEDELADDRALEQLRQRRLAQMRAAAARPRFGSYDEIGGGAEFVQRVTEASAQSWVACVLHQPGHAGCGLLHPALEELARRYPGTRFVRVLSTSAIPRYPDANLPTLLLYRRRKLVANLVGLQSLGGRRVTPESVALALNTHGRVCVELGDEGSEDEGEGGGSGGGSSTVAQVRGLLERLVAARDERGRASGDESSDFGDD